MVGFSISKLHISPISDDRLKYRLVLIKVGQYNVRCCVATTLSRMYAVVSWIDTTCVQAAVGPC